MTQSAVALKTITDNGHERRTDGVWSHLGRIVVGGANTQTLTSVLQTNGQHIISGAPPALSSQSYGQTQLQLVANAPGLVGIGFHEAGAAALTLYKLSGTDVGLRVRTASGVDYPLVGAPGSVNALVGQYQSGNGWSVGASGSFAESPITTGNVAFTGAFVRIEWMLNFLCSVAGGSVEIALGWDGAVSWTVNQVTAPAASYWMTASGIMYPGPPNTGTHRLSVFVKVTTGTFQFNGGYYQNLFVTEQRA